MFNRVEISSILLDVVGVLPFEIRRERVHLAGGRPARVHGIGFDGVDGDLAVDDAGRPCPAGILAIHPGINVPKVVALDAAALSAGMHDLSVSAVDRRGAVPFPVRVGGYGRKVAEAVGWPPMFNRVEISSILLDVVGVLPFEIRRERVHLAGGHPARVYGIGFDDVDHIAVARV